MLNLGPVRAFARTGRAKDNENVARPVTAKLLFDFLDFLLVAFAATKQIVRLFLLSFVKLLHNYCRCGASESVRIDWIGLDH
jgi:hypothetical protein